MAKAHIQWMPWVLIRDLDVVAVSKVVVDGEYRTHAGS